MKAALLTLLLGVNLPTADAKAKVYGFGSTAGPQYLESIDRLTGKLTHIGSPLSQELSAQQLSSIDHVNKVYYLLDYNETSKNPNLLGLSLVDGTLVVDQEIVMSESMFVGVGQYMAADVATGCVVIAAYDAAAKAYQVKQGCPFGPNPTKWDTVTSITAPNIGLLGSCSAIDSSRGIFYATMPVPPQGDSAPMALPRATGGKVRATGNRYMHMVEMVNGTAVVVPQESNGLDEQQPPPPPVPPFEIDLVAVSIAKATMGKTTFLGKPQLGTLAYDSLKRRIVGFGAKQDASGKFVKTLVAAPVPPSKKYATLGEIPKYEGQMGPISAADSKGRTLYGMLAPAPKGWLPSTDCKPQCASGALCCRFDPSYAGACFTVPSCAAMATPNMSAPFDLVGVSLDDGSLVDTKPPPLCSITDGKCPWSLEVDGP